jgi:glycosyltransferase involved in cell wall biosynthesis
MSPMKMFEYMAAGKPLVAQHHAVLEHVLRDGQKLPVHPPADDARAMAEAVGRLAGDAGLRARLGEAARRDVGPYTWRNRARDVLERFFDPGAFRAGTTA